MKTYIIWGPPASGKSTYVGEHKTDNAILYDFDALMRALSGLGPHKKNTNIIKYILGFKENLINKLKEEDRLDEAWIIQTWIDDTTKERLKDLKPEYVLMETTEELCIKRVEENDDRQASKDEQIKVIKDWFRKYNKLLGEKKRYFINL